MSSYVYISNANSIALSPPPASVTIGTGQSACVTATARNRQGHLVEDGATITFSYSASPSGGSYTLTQPSTGKMYGNFPQTYSMVGLIQAALRLSRSWEDAL